MTHAKFVGNWLKVVDSVGDHKSIVSIT